MIEAENSDESTRERTEVQGEAPEPSAQSGQSANTLSGRSENANDSAENQQHSVESPTAASSGRGQNPNSSGVSSAESAVSGAASPEGGSEPAGSVGASKSGEGSRNDPEADPSSRGGNVSNQGVNPSTPPQLRARERYMRKIGKIKD